MAKVIVYPNAIEKEVRKLNKANARKLNSELKKIHRDLSAHAVGNDIKVTGPEYIVVFQERGTGIYGPRHSYIVPKYAKFLAFKTKTGQQVFAKKVRGVRGKHKIMKLLFKFFGYPKKIGGI